MLKRGLQACQHVFGKGCCGRDNNVQFSAVLGDQFVEAFDDSFCLAEPAILRKHEEEVFSDFRNGLFVAFELGEEAGKGRVPFLNAECRVMEEGAYFGLLRDGGGNGVELGVDFGEGLGRLFEGGAVNGLGVLGSDR